jgi:hypothetical protein
MRRDSEAPQLATNRQVAIYVETTPKTEERIFIAKADELGEELAAIAVKRLTEKGLIFSRKYINGAPGEPKRPLAATAVSSGG